jgi:hypothetical protein
MAQRNAISLKEKRALRARRRLQPQISHQALKQWFEKRFNRYIGLSSVSEILSDRYSHLDEAILSRSEPKVEAETDEQLGDQLSKISHSEAMEALETLILYEEQQDEGNKEFLKALQRHRQVILLRMSQNQQQKDIRGCFC